MKVSPVLIVLVCSMLGGLTACEKTPEATHVAEPLAIKWFEGSVQEGFDLAISEQKPVYLYWGAVWCPPCQEIKHTVFKSKQFIAQTDLFVPIYLDGDTERAQAWGDKFGVKGYPTMIIFNPDGLEVTRIPGGIDIARYNSVLALSLDQMRPTSMLVKLALDQPDKLLAADFVQLAYYSWGQDAGSLPEGTPPTFFRDLAGMSPDKEAAARLYMVYLVALAEETSEAAQESVEAKSTGAFVRLDAIVSSPELTIASWDTLAYYAEEIITLPIFSSEEAAQLKTKWQEQMLAQRNQAVLSTAEQVAGWLPYLNFFFLEDKTASLPDETLVQLRQDLQRADEATSNAFARQSVVSQLNYVYQSAQLFDDARALLLAELDKSESPYYFMSSLAGLAEKQENTVDALQWRKRAYESAVGAATRFQWGANYVRALIRLTPDDQTLIVGTSMKLFDDLGAEQEIFAGRNFRILRSLNSQLSQWQQEITDDNIVQAFTVRLKAMCEHQTQQSLEKENCESLYNLQSDATI